MSIFFFFTKDQNSNSLYLQDQNHILVYILRYLHQDFKGDDDP